MFWYYFHNFWKNRKKHLKNAFISSFWHLFACFKDGTTTTEAPTTTTLNPDADCRNFTLNRCNFGNDTLITSVFQEDDEYCNFLCQVTYGDKQLLADKCSYFIYDYTNQQCDGISCVTLQFKIMWKEPLFKGKNILAVYGSTWKDFPTFCNEKGGPLSPMVDNCRREHYCNVGEN